MKKNGYMLSQQNKTWKSSIYSGRTHLLRIFDQHCLMLYFQGRFDEVQKAPKRPTKAPREIKDLVSILLWKSFVCAFHIYICIFACSVFLAQVVTFSFL